MKKYSISGSDWFLMLPNDWVVENDGNTVSTYDPIRGIGTLQISMYQNFELSEIVLRDYLEDYVSNKYHDITLGQFDDHISATCPDRENGFWKFWLFTKSKSLFFTSYNCSKENDAEEKTIVEKIVEDLRTC